ncbi:ABC transporter ATP-binding protein [Paenibacillus alkalitolerans]|uniref:ABC transporter ATP-binding protein n=1 Tax=Paenibacillus alkalitolerans TaxID=2799335 RepID=UPI0018F7C1B6|nr:ABC transporter ATP-binding protein [Paenibacillus alkalitolerans]
MTHILLYLRKLHRFAGIRLYVNVLCMIALSVFDAVGIYLLVPMLGLIGLFDAGMEQIPLVSPLLEALRGMPAQSGLPIILAIYILLIAGQALLQRGQSIQSVRIQQGFIRHLRLGIYESLMRSKWMFFVKQRKSDFHHILTSELARVSQATYLFLQLNASLVFTVIQLGFAFWLSAKLTAVVLASGIAIALFMRKNVRRAKAVGNHTTELSQSYFAGITDHFNGIKDIKSNRLEASHLAWFRSLVDRMESNFVTFARLQANTQLLYKTAAAVLIALFVYLSVEVLNVAANQLLLIIIIFARLWPRFTSIQSGAEQIVSSVPAFRSVLRLEAECSEAREQTAFETFAAREPMPVVEGIECRNVYFRHDPNGSSYALRNICIHIPAGGMTAIIGKSGAGKSTLIDILMGLLEPERGTILIDGVPVTSEGRLALRHSISYVSQDPFLFNASIRENLLIVHPEANEEDLWEALRFSASDEFVKMLPEGLDTVVGDRGVRLSGGERQRLVLARAILRKPSILVLDEATSALDNENEAKIQNAIDRLKGKLTIIVIAHRLSTIRNADQVIVLEQGEVVKQEGNQQLVR